MTPWWGLRTHDGAMKHIKYMRTLGLAIAGILAVGCSPTDSAASEPKAASTSASTGKSVYATLEDGVLTLANNRIERRFAWNEGNLKSLDITDPVLGRRWVLTDEEPDIAPFGSHLDAKNGALQVREVSMSPIAPAHIEAQIIFESGALEVKRTCLVFENVPAIDCTLAFRGATQSLGEVVEASRQMIETSTLKSASLGSVIEHLAMPKGHWRFEFVNFRVATDHNDWLVDESQGEIYRQNQKVTGNIIRFEDPVGGGQIFIVKRAPVGADQVAYPGHDFVVGAGSVQVVGSGVVPTMLNAKTWQEAYAVSVGVADSGKYAGLLAMREHHETMRTYNHARDGMILMNTWGDRNRDASLNEAFVFTELQAAAKLGISHFQLDDGWQVGLSKNSAKKSGALWDNWTAAAWEPHPERFPRGLMPVVERAKEHEIEIGLWFNPTKLDEYATWERDADTLIDLYERYGIRIFKIDGIETPTRLAEENLGRFFKKVYSATKGAVVFNVDVTAGRRLGYIHPLNNYGNIFVENRYTDWGNYYPYRTLRNLWSLSAYVPPQFLQMEFLNVWRNPDKYPENDPFAPSQVPFEYAFAVTMMSQPLAWMEATGLPPEALEAADAIKKYRLLAPKIHAGRIMPIGERPDGTSWTGFQSIAQGGKTGYMLLFREVNDRKNAVVKTALPQDRYACFVPLLGAGLETGAAFGSPIGSQGNIQVELTEPHSYALYAYTVHATKAACS